MKKKITLVFQGKNYETLKCTECRSPRLHMVGDVLQCLDCDNVRALS